MDKLNEKALTDDQVEQVSGGRRRPRDPYTDGAGVLSMTDAETLEANDGTIPGGDSKTGKLPFPLW